MSVEKLSPDVLENDLIIKILRLYEDDPEIMGALTLVSEHQKGRISSKDSIDYLAELIKERVERKIGEILKDVDLLSRNDSEPSMIISLRKQIPSLANGSPVNRIRMYFKLQDACDDIYESKNQN